MALMAQQVWEIPINASTSRTHLERCILEAAHTSDSNVTRAAADARTELARREQEEWTARFNAQESARVKAQQFQAGQIDKQIEAQERLMGQQIEVAKEHAEAAESAARAARRLVWVTAALAVLTAALAAIEAIPLY